VRKIVIFANDAGGSELLLELLRASLHVGEFRVFYIQNSPCQKILKQKCLDSYAFAIQASQQSVSDALDKINPDIILYSTGWQNHVEYYFLNYAREHKIPSVAFLDNWANYKERFSYPDASWKDNFPTYIATHDEFSEKKAKELGLENLVAIKNYSLINELQNFKNVRNATSDILLFLSEPTSVVAKKTYGDEHYWGFTECDVFKSILKHQHKFGCSNIVVRLHPSDTADAYKKIASDITISDLSLQEDIARAKFIVGVDSSVLYLAYLLGKKVIAYLPSTNRDFHVPLPKQNQFTTLENLNPNLLQINTADVKEYGVEFASFIKNILG